MGAEVDLYRQHLAGVDTTLITGHRSEVGTASVGGEYVYASHVHDSRIDGAPRIGTSAIIDSNLESPRIDNSTIEGSTLHHNGTVSNSTIRKSNIQRAHDPWVPKGLKVEKFNVFDSTVEGYDDSETQVDTKMTLVGANVTDTDDVKVVRGVVVYPSKDGQTVYKTTPSPQDEPLTTPKDVVSAKHGLKRKDRKAFQAELEAASK